MRRAPATRASAPATKTSSRSKTSDKCKAPEKCHAPDTSEHAPSHRLLVPPRVAVSVRRKHRVVAVETVTDAASIDAFDFVEVGTGVITETASSTSVAASDPQQLPK